MRLFRPLKTTKRLLTSAFAETVKYSYNEIEITHGTSQSLVLRVTSNQTSLCDCGNMKDPQSFSRPPPGQMISWNKRISGLSRVIWRV